MSTDKNIPITDPDFNERSSGVGSTISWERLAELLTREGAVRSDEQISGLRVTTTGITYYMEKKEK